MQARKLIGGLFSVMVAALTAAKFAADWVGRSTLPEDASSLLGKLVPMIVFLQEQPAVLFYGFQALFVVAGLAFIAMPARKTVFPEVPVAPLVVSRGNVPVQRDHILSSENRETYQYNYLLAIRNDSGRTVRGVALEIEHAGQVDSLKAWRTTEPVVLKPGTTVEYRIAHVLQPEEVAVNILPTIRQVPAREFENLAFQQQFKAVWIVRGASPEIAIIGALAQWEQQPELNYIVSADDVPSIRFSVTVNPGTPLAILLVH